MPYFSSVRTEETQILASGSSAKQRQSYDDSPRLPLPVYSREASIVNHAVTSPEVFEEKPSSGTPLPLVSPAAVSPPSDCSSSSRRQGRKSSRLEQGLRVHWARLLKKVGNREVDSSESVVAGSEEETDAEVEKAWGRRRVDADAVEEGEDDIQSVDEVIVDRLWGRSKTIADSTSGDGDGAEKSDDGPNNPRSVDNGRSSSSGELDGHHFLGALLNYCFPLTILRCRLWPLAADFFFTRFSDNKKAEAHYRKEGWFQSKPLALWSSLFFVINWVLGCALVPRPFTIADTIFYFGVAPVLTLPIPFLVMFDFAHNKPLIYNIAIIVSTWSWSIFQLIDIFLCGYYSGEHKYGLSCGNKDFLSLFYYTSALQTVALFGLKMKRFPAMLGAIVFLVMSASMVIPFRIGWIRNALNFLCFQAFLLYIHYMKEVSQRRLFLLRDRLKKQYKETQRAQMNEKKAAESKRRLTSYVRVPLNTALIAVQNMNASGSYDKEQEVEFSALSGSLSMMSKVLNDVLDFNRMDSGRLESVSMPYSLHAVMRSMFVPLQLATDARQLHFVTELDKSIDLVARRAVWDSLIAQNKLVVQDGFDAFEKELEAHPNEDGIVVGDEMRLRQIVTNLVSNACKFTPTGGTLIVRTKLVSPSAPHSLSERKDIHSKGIVPATSDFKSPKTPAEVDLERGFFEGLTPKTLDQHNATHRKASPLEKIVVRIEVTDTGYGIKAKDIKKGKLFSAFNQTEQGRLQGGKGTGLGLALVRHIVSLSGGRLGVQSKVGVGSTFWVELPLGVGKKAAGGTTSSGQSSDGRSGPSVIAGPRPKTNPVQAGTKPGSAASASGSITRTDGQSNTLLDSRNSIGRLSQTSSAFKGLMDQGGLVELEPTRCTSGTTRVIPTRSIGDPSTGTDAGSLLGDPPSPDNNDLAGERKTVSAVLHNRPSHVDLPKRPLFGQGSPPPSPNQTSQNKVASTTTALDPPLRVLVVDDDQLTRRLMKRMLQRLGCIVSTAENGQIAFDLITGDGRTPASDINDVPGQAAASSPGTPMQREFDGPRYEVIFLDNQMPVLSGLELVAKLRELGRRDFVVGVTGNALLSDQDEYRDAGVDYVITKPVYEINLKSMIALAAERRKNGEPSPGPVGS